MTQNREDLRVKRTQTLLKNALIDLTEEKGFDEVTVGDIAKRAMVNRATFYRHYQDKYDLVTNIFIEATDKVSQEISPTMWNPEIFNSIMHELDSSPEHLINQEISRKIETFAEFFDHFANNAKLYQIMLGKRGSSWFKMQLLDYFNKVLLQRLHASDQYESLIRDKTNSIPEDMAAISLANLFLGIVSWWLDKRDEITSRQIAIWTMKIIIYGYLNTLGYKIFN